MTGFSEESGVRRFKFKGTFANRTNEEFMVETDVALARKYSIPLQELPLLCRRLLEKDSELLNRRLIVFDEQLMREHSDQRAAAERASHERRKAHRRPSPTRVGEHWRGQQPPQQ
ncbi:MAG TPA: hypothetical protein VG456_00445 [Candidatus Sulfopaludibacter sp.]|nr:hypothetical protein [Candidatus Sulfopaludibacter sp.]